MAEKAFDPIKSWFDAAEALGEYIGIRFGRLRPGSNDPEWMFMPHCDYDGIGGFAEILRQRGAVLSKLPVIKHPSNPSWMPLIKSGPKLLKPRRALEWNIPSDKIKLSTNAQPPSAVAWHVFDEIETSQIRRACRKGGFTVNSFLLKHVSKAVRPCLKDEASVIPWMVPVNLRGKVFRDRDTANFSAYVGVKIASYETIRDVHRKIYEALGRGEHWANWYAYKSGHVLSHGMKKQMVTSGRCMAEWYLGSFSNLGDWDADKKLNSPGCLGGWLFSPPVLRCQLVGAGCVTFQNRLSLTIQTHPELTTDVAVPRNWMQNWVREIEMDLSSLLSDAVTTPARLAAA
ncbi:MAG TPA: hypothetical protein VG754_14215 [Verrucomicrobiae bacterium]|jgi:NRPS condensation-like uncharacterized protein|nr:hypothetical protein [Verrucomicrobiae bacterium]